MTDPRLQSMHLESAPRRDEFRRARGRVQSCLGEHTIAGDLRLIQGLKSKDATDCRSSHHVGGSISNCWLLDQGRQLNLKIGLNSVGRLPDNDVVVNDPSVSRRHCAIVVHSDLSVELHDVASKNGTTINGRKLTVATRLHDGDEIVLCDRKLIFMMQSGSPTMDRSRLRQSQIPDDITLAG